MEVPISQFRKNLFQLVNRAFEGTDVWVLHNGRRFKIAPDPKPGSRLSRISRLDIMNPNDSGRPSLLEEMTRAWESDWSDL